MLFLYLLGITGWGVWLGRGQSGSSDYFLGNRGLPWPAVMLSIVATETSTLTFLSIPGISYLGTLTFLQVTFGYLLGRIVIAGLLLPAYFRGDLSTAYVLLGSHFGETTQKVSSAVFMVTRLLSDAVRLFVTAIPMAFITGWSYPVSIGVIGLATVVYTYFGGIKAVVWVDVVQMCLYVGGAVVSIIALQTLVPGGWSEIITSAREAGKMTIIESSFDLSVPYTIWAGVIGGGFLTMASHGTDQLIVQRILSCGDITAAKKAMIGSGMVVLGQIFIFLMVGLGLWRYYDAATFASSDQIFAEFVVEALPPGISGLLVAGVFAAAMSSLSSSINALASATTYDFFAVMSQKDDAALLKVGKLSTLVWSVLLIGGAILFIPFSEGSAAVEVALSVSSIAYGGLLGAFLVAVFSISKDQVSVISGMVLAIGTVTFIWLFARDAVAWPWFVPIGSAITVLVAGILGRVRVSSSRESKS